MALKDRFSANNWPPDMGLQEKYSPDDFVTDRHYFGTFNNTETEVSARWIMRFLQDREQGWDDFTFEQINTYYNNTRKANGQKVEEFWFNRLVPGTHKHMTAQSFPYGETRKNDWVICVTRGAGACPTAPDGTPVERFKYDDMFTITDKFIYPLVKKGYLKKKD